MPYRRLTSAERIVALRSGALAGVPVVLGYLSIGFAAGVVQRVSGLSIAETLLLSTVLYAGSAQFVVAGLVAAALPGALPVAAITATVFLVNLRHLLLAAALAPHFREASAWKSGLLGLQLTDETFVVASTRLRDAEIAPRIRVAWMAGLNLSAYGSWALGNLAGALASGVVGDVRSLGLDLALPAMFCALLVLQFERSRSSSVEVQAEVKQRNRIGLLTVLVSMIVAWGLSGVVAGHWIILVATVTGATLALIAGRRWKSVRTS
jgi:4-azaleucine resistance transporter AzlC